MNTSLQHPSALPSAPETIWRSLRRPGYLVSAWPWRAYAYLLLNALVGPALFVLLLLSLVALPLWALIVGAFERRRGILLGFPRQLSAHAVPDRPGLGAWLRLRLTEPLTWREVAAVLVNVAAGFASWIILTIQSVFVGFVIQPLWFGPSDYGSLFIGGWRFMNVTSNTWPLTVIVGVGVILVSAYFNGLVAGGQGVLMQILCGPREAELVRNVEELRSSRAEMATGFEDERRRIERDLHDGLQQELVTLAARLGMVSLELDDLEQEADVTKAREALAAVEAQADHAMQTLRASVRGIQPAVLTNEGLVPALEGLASRAVLPVLLTVDVPARLPAAIESAAYYFVSEAVTNAVKHSSARTVSVAVFARADSADITVSDDGEGGVVVTGGGGLEGLQERADTLNGRVDITSPIGGPTVLSMSLPLSSAL